MPALCWHFSLPVARDGFELRAAGSEERP